MPDTPPAGPRPRSGRKCSSRPSTAEPGSSAGSRSWSSGPRHRPIRRTARLWNAPPRHNERSPRAPHQHPVPATNWLAKIRHRRQRRWRCRIFARQLPTPAAGLVGVSVPLTDRRGGGQEQWVSAWRHLRRRPGQSREVPRRGARPSGQDQRPYSPTERWLSVVSQEDPDGVGLVLHLTDEAARPFRQASREIARPVISRHRRLPARRRAAQSQGRGAYENKHAIIYGVGGAVARAFACEGATGWSAPAGCDRQTACTPRGSRPPPASVATVIPGRTTAADGAP
jgi:hypothetical protein